MANTKTHIIFLIGQLGMGGYEKQMTLLVNSIDQSEYIPLIIVWGDEKGPYNDQLVSNGFEVVSLSGFNVLKKILIIRDYIKRNSSKIIHNYSFYLNLITWLASLFTSAQPIGAIRSNVVYESKSMSMLIKFLNLWLPTMIVFNNFSAKKYLQSTICLPSKKDSIVIQNGIDISLYPKVKYKDGSTTKLICVGSLTEIKRQDWLIRIAKRLDSCKVDIHIDIIGDGPLYNDLKNQIQNLGLQKIITLHGNQDSPIDYLLMADIFLHPSSAEGFPNAVLEAMAVGLPIIATEVGDIPLMIEDNKQGFVTAKDNFNLFYQRLLYLIENPDRRQEFGLAAMKKAEREYTHDQLIKNIVNLYNNLQKA